MMSIFRPNPERPSRPHRCAAFILAQLVWIGVTRTMRFLDDDRGRV
jgi:hypothetical protein